MVHVYEADTNQAGSLGTVILTGAITDYGTDYQGAGPGGTNLFVLSKGSFAVDVSAIGNQFQGLPEDQATCTSDGTVSGPITIVHGSGKRAYAGISGTLDTTASTAYVVPGSPGQCNWNATQYPGVLIANAAGTVKYGGGN